MDTIPCPDGYLLDPKSELDPGHHALNDYLVRVEEAGWQTALKEVNGIRDKARKLVIWKALIERMIWLRDSGSRTELLSPLRGLAERIEGWTLAPTEADLIAILDRTAEAANFLAPSTPMPRVFAYLDANPLTPGLAAAVRRFRERVYDDGLVVNQVSLQLLRSRLDMLAWRDEWTPVDLKRCWSERIRADYRAMQGEEREAWRRLLYCIRGDEGTRPSKKWSAATEAAIETIGREAFRAQIAEWFAALRAGAVQRLSREGSFVLRAFVWLAEASQDPGLAALLPEIAEVQFKPKGNGQKVLRAAREAAGAPETPAPIQDKAPTLDDLLARSLGAVFSPVNALAMPGLAGRVEVNGDVALVRGTLDRYEVHLNDGSIFRQSDGRQVRIDSSRSQPFPTSFVGLGAMMEIVQNLLLLAEDEKNAAALKIQAQT